MKHAAFSLLLVVQASGFMIQQGLHATNDRLAKSCSFSRSSSTCLNFTPPKLFDEDEEMIPVAEAYIHAKYKQVAAENGHAVANKDDIRKVLHGILPPVTSNELEKEEEAILKSLLSHKQNSADAIDEDDFVKSIFKNSYWNEAGDIVVKELMYFDSVSVSVPGEYEELQTGDAVQQHGLCFDAKRMTIFISQFFKNYFLKLPLSPFSLLYSAIITTASLILQDWKTTSKQ